MRRLSYEALKEWLWQNGYAYFLEFIDYQEDRFPNLMAELKVYHDNSITLTMRDRTTYKWHSEANLGPKSVIN